LPAATGSRSFSFAAGFGWRAIVGLGENEPLNLLL
jgi:hypothetical protein